MSWSAVTHYSSQMKKARERTRYYPRDERDLVGVMGLCMRKIGNAMLATVANEQKADCSKLRKRAEKPGSWHLRTLTATKKKKTLIPLLLGEWYMCLSASLHSSHIIRCREWKRGKYILGMYHRRIRGDEKLTKGSKWLRRQNKRERKREDKRMRDKRRETNEANNEWSLHCVYNKSKREWDSLSFLSMSLSLPFPSYSLFT